MSVKILPSSWASAADESITRWTRANIAKPNLIKSVNHRGMILERKLSKAINVDVYKDQLVAGHLMTFTSFHVAGH